MQIQKFQIKLDMSVIRNLRNVINNEQHISMNKKYFKYIRSLCSGHPSDTSFYKEMYQDNDFECSPFVIWNSGIFSNDYDIDIVVYTNAKGSHTKRIGLKIEEIFQYVKYRYNLIKKIIESIQKYQQEIIQVYKNTFLKNENEFDSYIEYLEYLKEIEKERFGDCNIHLLEYALDIFKLNLSNKKNKILFEKYKEIYKYAINFTHNEIQNMTREGFENSGIKNNNSNGSLLDIITFEHCNSKETNDFHYQLEKIGYLDYDSGYENKQWAYTMLKQIKPFLERHVHIEGANGDLEHYILVNMALYFDSLENNCILNDNVPNSLLYRKILLTNE